MLCPERKTISFYWIQMTAANASNACIWELNVKTFHYIQINDYLKFNHLKMNLLFGWIASKASKIYNSISSYFDLITFDVCLTVMGKSDFSRKRDDISHFYQRINSHICCSFSLPLSLSHTHTHLSIVKHIY